MRQRFLQKISPRGRKIDSFLVEAFTQVESSLYAKVNNVLVIVIFLSIIFMILESVDSLYNRFTAVFEISEIVIVIIFSIEYLINIYVAQIEYRNRIRYVFSFWGLIDILAILPTYLGLINLSALKAVRIFRILRFLRMLRVLKLARHTANTMNKTRDKKFNTIKYDLQIYFFALSSVVIVFGTLAYFAESKVNPGFSSIPASMWWTFVTITTVGYGDVSPVTLAGKLIAVPTMLSGLVLFGMLMNVIGKAMMELLFGKGEEEENSPAAQETIKPGSNEIVIRLQSDDPEKLKKAVSMLQQLEKD